MSKKIFQLFHTFNHTTTAYNPQCNGLAERTNGSLVQSISLFVSAHQRDWDKILPFATHAYNTSVHSVTGYSPHELLFGRPACLPQDVTVNSDTLGIDNASDYYSCVTAWMKIARASAKKAIEASQSAYAKRNPAKKKGVSPKFKTAYNGPYKIVRQLNPVVFEIENFKRKSGNDFVHVSRLKKFFPRVTQQRLPSETEIYDVDAEFASNESSSDKTETYEVQNSEPVKRQSQRVTKRPGYLKNFVTVLFSLCFIMNHQAYAALPKVSPLMWRKTTKTVTTGIGSLTAYIEIYPPCDFFMDLSLCDIELCAQLLHWCDTLFTNQFERSLIDFCPPLTDPIPIKHRRREKRVAVLAILLVGAVILGVSAIIANAVITHNRISSLDDEVTKLREKLQIEIQKNEQNRLAIQKLQISVEMLSNTVEKLVHTFVNTTKIQTKAMIAVTNANSIVIEGVRIIRKAKALWSRNIVDPELFTLLNITLECGKNCPISDMKPLSCSYNVEKKRILLKTITRYVNPSLYVYQSDAMTLLVSNNENFCTFKYSGPRNMVFNTDNSCAYPLSYAEMDSEESVILPPDEKACEPRINNTLVDYFSTDTCFAKNAPQLQYFVQIRNYGNVNHIYCYLHEITVLNIRSSCPDYTFALPIQTNFSIDGRNYSSQNIELQTIAQFSPDMSFKINFHLAAELNTDHFNQIRRLINESKKLTEESANIGMLPFWEQTWFLPLLIFAGFLAFLMTISIVTFLICRKRQNMTPQLPTVSYQSVPSAPIHHESVLAPVTVTPRYEPVASNRRKTKNIVIPDHIPTNKVDVNYEDLKFFIEDMDWNKNEYCENQLFFVLRHLMKMCNEKEVNKCANIIKHMKRVVLAKSSSATTSEVSVAASFCPVPQKSVVAPPVVLASASFCSIPQESTSPTTQDISLPSTSSTNIFTSSMCSTSHSSNQTEVSVAASLCPVPQSNSKWWSVYGENIYSIDCEFVRVVKNGKNIQKCATLSVYDWNENEVLKRKVFYRPNEIIADRFLYLITGFTSTSFLDGSPFEEVRREVINLLKGKLCIVCGGEGDLKCLEIDSDSLFTRKEIIDPPITFYDIQNYYWYNQTLDNGSVVKSRHSLRSLVSYFFDTNIQSSIHTASSDSQYTLKIFKHHYVTSPKPKINLYPSPEIPVLINPLKSKFKKSLHKKVKKY
ncbi:Pol polyprotein-like protein [Leptotrombidium deliense]|uniref:Pol polyprotein-like protein n=1 Tax=Leptotrombidium deliense TaxID=299467 RepID=A0A443SKP2_9ACAR|nr:Pol polyprotein-like protein [Leptotrombidium deliense]